MKLEALPWIILFLPLLAAGEREKEKAAQLKKATDWLAKVKMEGTYTLGIRCQVWSLLPREIESPDTIP